MVHLKSLLIDHKCLSFLAFYRFERQKNLPVRSTTSLAAGLCPCERLPSPSETQTTRNHLQLREKSGQHRSLITEISADRDIKAPRGREILTNL